MGSACSCAGDGSASSDEGAALADKANGHVLDHGPQNGHGGSFKGIEKSLQTKGDHIQNGLIKEDIAKNGLAGVTLTSDGDTAKLLDSKDIRLEDASFVDRVIDQGREGNAEFFAAPSSGTPMDTPPTVPLTPVKAGDGEMSEEELVNIMAGELAALVSRLETAVERLEKVGSVSGKSASGGVSAGTAVLSTQAQEEECTVPYVLAYDDLLSGPFKVFVDCSNQIGGDVATIAKLVQETFINQRAFLVMASKSQRPLDTELPQVLEPTGKKIQEVIAFRESKRQSPLFNHLSAVSESIPGLSWVAVTPAPGPYVKEMGDSAIFYTNRVLKEYREKDKLHVEWVQNWNNVFKELQSYVLAHHTTGLSWNTRGGNAMNNLKPAPANCGVPPPPPPGNIPPPPPMVKLEPKVIPADDGRAALFESINKGTDITSGLKKVTDDMKTHKNPSLREGPKPFVKASSGAPTTVTKEASPPARPPKIALEGKKWYVEYQQDKPNLLISQTRMDQCVYIYRCVNTVVQIKGKVNSVILDSCKKSSVVFDNLVSSAEVVNCQSCQVQVMGVMPTLSIEKTDGCQVYLSKESLKTEIISAKSTEMNVLIPNDDGDFTECPIPEQFKTVVNGLSLTTTCTEAAG
ncbi:adenylyl cyclase-associated protein 1 isoform X3 [Macrobrachium rosenbergii]|uniref:adenylyl cyclase-associated protein 1 isoform X3 n=1 Tax=Macrobrachium rosenbergii TaxID=79674 RepID=UPI0034D49221